MAAMTDFKRGPKLGDAASLWNFTPSPGWTADQAATLKLCLMRLGVGRWVQIQATGLLPGKMVQQLNGQTQRLLGQQSLAAYTGLQVDVDRIRRDNEARTDAQRKGGLIIWTGANPTRAMRDGWQVEAKAKYGLTPEQLAAVEAEFDERVEALRVMAGGGEGSGKGGAGGAGVNNNDGGSNANADNNNDASAASVLLDSSVSSLLASSDSVAVKPLAGDAKLLLLKELRDKLAEVAAAVAVAAAEEKKKKEDEAAKKKEEEVAKEAVVEEAAAGATATATSSAPAAAAAAAAPMETDEAAPAVAAPAVAAAAATTTATATAAAAQGEEEKQATATAPPPAATNDDDAPVDAAAVAAGRPSAPPPSKRASAPSNHGSAVAAGKKKEAAARKKAKTFAAASRPPSASNNNSGDTGGAVSQVVAMGFPREKAMEALAESGGDVAAALEWLCSNLC